MSGKGSLQSFAASSAKGRTCRPPWHGSSPARFVCGGAQRGISLAPGFFTGESRRNPLDGNLTRKYQDISSLANHDFGLLDSFVKSTKSSLPNPLGQIHLAKSRLPDGLQTQYCPDMDRVFAPGGTGRGHSNG